MNKKLKKLLKTVGKVGGALMLGKALMGGKKGTPSTNAAAIKAMTSNDAYSDDTMPSNLGTMRSTPRKRNMYSSNDFGLGPYDMAKGGRAGLKGGGKVKGCGIAKRGLGRAMKKGKR